jgi:cold shock CspA family protein
MADITQGTVKEYDTASRTGTIVSDQGDEISIDTSSLGDGHVRFLRQGQRVAFEPTDSGGDVVARSLRLVTFPA